MKKIVAALMVVLMLPISSFANDCDFKTGITKVETGYLYTKECHIKVGLMDRDLKIALEQNSKLMEAVSLKTQALDLADKRAALWQETSYKLESRIETMDKLYDRNKWLWFGLGVLAASAAVYGASQLTK